MQLKPGLMMNDYASEQTRLAAQKLAEFISQARKFGAGLLLCVLFLTVISKGMPLHELWPLLGTAAVLVTLFFFVKTVQFAGMALTTWLIEREPERKSQEGPVNTPEYTPPKSRSGRRRSRPN
jgi:hypothetical protein